MKFGILSVLQRKQAFSDVIHQTRALRGFKFNFLSVSNVKELYKKFFTTIFFYENAASLYKTMLLL